MKIREYINKLEIELEAANARIKILETENAQNNAAAVTFDLCVMSQDRDNWREIANALAEVARHIGYTSSEETRVCVEAERALAAYLKLKEGK